MNYHPNMSPRALRTAPRNIMSGYPAYWELMKWYLCWRKVPYSTEIIATLLAETRGEEYSAYPCPLDAHHWHIGRGGGGKTNRERISQAKRTYRKAVRDEIWRSHVEQKTEERELERAGT